MLYFQTKANKNGNKKQLIVDLENKTIQIGSFLFNGCFKEYTQIENKKNLDILADQFINAGFTHLIKL